jgi:hypothetical protein
MEEGVKREEHNAIADDLKWFKELNSEILKDVFKSFE